MEPIEEIGPAEAMEITLATARAIQNTIKEKDDAVATD